MQNSQDKIEATLNKIEQSLKSKGKRLTLPRRRVFKALLTLNEASTAYQLVDHLGDVNPMTVYRALEFLTHHGLAHRIESLNAYMACAESHCAHKDSQYTVCDSCGTVEEIHNHDLDHMLKALLAQKGFAVEFATIEAHGSCQKCFS